jgi:hypothetical protein
MQVIIWHDGQPIGISGGTNLFDQKNECQFGRAIVDPHEVVK